MATVVTPGTDRLTAQFCQLAKHYGVEVRVCPPRRPQRKGVVEAAIKYLTRSWWRSAPVASLGQAQADLDRWAGAVADRRRRRGATIAELAAKELLLTLPAAAFPAQLEVERVVSRTALVAFEGNRYSVAPSLVGQTVTVRARLGELHLEIASAAGRRLARHRRAPAGAGQLLRSAGHAPPARGRRPRAVHDGEAVPGKGKPSAGRASARRGRGSTWTRQRRGSRRPRPIRPDREGRRPMSNKHATYQQLRSHLAYLKLAAAAEALPGALEAAERDGPGYTQFLCDLLDVEVKATEERRLAGRLRLAGFPSHKTLEEFDFSSRSPRSIAGSSRSSRRCASSRSARTPC